MQFVLSKIYVMQVWNHFDSLVRIDDSIQYPTPFKLLDYFETLRSGCVLRVQIHTKDEAANT